METRQLQSWYWKHFDKWMCRPGRCGLEGSHMVYLRAYNEAKAEKKKTQIQWMALDHRRAKRHWSAVFSQRKGEW